MKNLAQQININDAAIFAGTVKSVLDKKYVVHNTNGQILIAPQASSCLIRPNPGDKVLVTNMDNCPYVLAVLEKQNVDSSTITFEGDLNMEIPDGEFNLNAQNNITLSTPKDLTIFAEKLGLTGEDLITAFQKINIYSTAVEGHLHQVKLMSQKVQSTVSTVVNHYSRRHTCVDGIDSIKASAIKQTAKHILSLKSKFTFIHATKNVKVDGQQILMG